MRAGNVQVGSPTLQFPSRRFLTWAGGRGGAGWGDECAQGFRCSVICAEPEVGDGENLEHGHRESPIGIRRARPNVTAQHGGSNTDKVHGKNRRHSMKNTHT